MEKIKKSPAPENNLSRVSINIYGRMVKPVISLPKQELIELRYLPLKCIIEADRRMRYDCDKDQKFRSPVTQIRRYWITQLCVTATMMFVFGAIVIFAFHIFHLVLLLFGIVMMLVSCCLCERATSRLLYLYKKQ